MLTLTFSFTFMQVVLQLGGIQPMEIAKLLQAERSKGSNVAVLMRSFALELAYILENFGDDGADESKLILDLYLQGCRSLMLAVSYAQRTPSRSEQLWESLIDHCLSDKQAQQPSAARASDPGSFKSQTKSGKISGSLFGSLLEAAALSGADLAHLVQQIPPGMAVEGLRPRLVSAVADSRFKVQMQEMARDIASTERMSLVRELEHRSRRGMRYSRPVAPGEDPTSLTRTDSPQPATLHSEDSGRGRAGVTAVSHTLETRIRRAVPRQDRYRLSLTIPIR
jgi:vacuolar protein sorting-associated protein 41